MRYLILIPLLLLGVGVASSQACGYADLNCDGKWNSTDQLLLAQEIIKHMTPEATWVPTSSPTSTPTETISPSSTPTSTPTAVPTATSTSLPTASSTGTGTPTPTPPPLVTRNPYTWPCAADSIWNMPIGSGAVLVPAGLQQAFSYGGISNDEEYIDLDSADPLKPLNGGGLVHVRSTLSHDGSWNGVAALLGADGVHVAQGQPLVLSAGGSPSWRYTYPTVDIRGDCIDGAHGGSGLSSFGGSIRAGELTSAEPIRHALKLNVYAKRFLSCSQGGYRWPARRADSYESCTTYGGVVPQVRMGALLTLAPNFDCGQFTSGQARKLCTALHDYGAYVVDDALQDLYAFDMDTREDGPFDDGSASWRTDLMTVITSLMVVDNNGPSTIGGGGTPRAPMAPPFSS